MNLISNVVVIIEARSVGYYLAPKLKKRGYACIHVSVIAPDSIVARGFPIQTEDFIATFHCPEKDAKAYQTLLEALKQYDIKLILPGCEAGVLLADRLSDHFNLFSNGLQKSEARRNKFKMIEAVKKAGLLTANQCLANDVPTLLNWQKQNEIDWPIILKPLSSSGTDLITFCFNETEIQTAFENILQHLDLFGEQNTSVLAQSYLKGTEYIVNTISQNGIPHVTDIWRYHKIPVLGAAPIYDYAKLLPANDEHAPTLSQYTFQVLNALDIQHGAAHTEIMLTQKGPALIESAARVMGTVPPDLITEAISYNQLDLMLDSYLNPKAFLKTMGKPYTIKKHFLIKLLISTAAGKIKSIRHLKNVQKLPSYREAHWTVKIGGSVYKTIDLLTSPGYVILIHENEAQVMKDYEQIVAWEKDLFELEKKSS